MLNETGIRTLRRRPLVTTPNVFPTEHNESQQPADETVGERHCYVCKSKYSRLHAFYDQLCPTCGEENFAARTELADLGGRVALLTGGRVKIGYQAGLSCSAPARISSSTRFPQCGHAVRGRGRLRQWAHRLEIFGLDPAYAERRGIL